MMIRGKYKKKIEFQKSLENQGIKAEIFQPKTNFTKGSQLEVKSFISLDSKNKYNINNRDKDTAIVSNIYKRNEGSSELTQTNKFILTTKKEINLDDSHKKWGIRPKEGNSTNETSNFKITVNKYPNDFSYNPDKVKYESKTGQNKYNKTDKTLLKPSIYISGSSQSNIISTNSAIKKHQRNFDSDLPNQKSASNIFRSANKQNLINYKQNWSNQSNNPTITSKRSSTNNTMSYSIIETKKTYQQPYTLHVRKLDRIQSEIKHRKLNDEKALAASNSNHSIFVTRNVTKEQLTVADLPDNGKIKHRYNYNYNPNLSNIAKHSICDIKEKEKKEIVVVPRRNERIVSNKPSRNNLTSIELPKGLYKSSSQYNIFRNENNFNNKKDDIYNNTYNKNNTTYNKYNNNYVNEPYNKYKVNDTKGKKSYDTNNKSFKKNEINNEPKNIKVNIDLSKYYKKPEPIKNNKNSNVIINKIDLSKYYKIPNETQNKNKKNSPIITKINVDLSKYKKKQNEPKKTNNTYEINKYNKKINEQVNTNKKNYEPKYNKTEQKDYKYTSNYEPNQTTSKIGRYTNKISNQKFNKMNNDDSIGDSFMLSNAKKKGKFENLKDKESTETNETELKQGKRAYHRRLRFQSEKKENDLEREKNDDRKKKEKKGLENKEESKEEIKNEEVKIEQNEESEKNEKRKEAIKIEENSEEPKEEEKEEPKEEPKEEQKEEQIEKQKEEPKEEPKEGQIEVQKEGPKEEPKEEKKEEQIEEQKEVKADEKEEKEKESTKYGENKIVYKIHAKGDEKEDKTIVIESAKYVVSGGNNSIIISKENKILPVNEEKNEDENFVNKDKEKEDLLKTTEITNEDKETLKIKKDNSKNENNNNNENDAQQNQEIKIEEEKIQEEIKKEKDNNENNIKQENELRIEEETKDNNENTIKHEHELETEKIIQEKDNKENNGKQEYEVKTKEENKAQAQDKYENNFQKEVKIEQEIIQEVQVNDIKENENLGKEDQSSKKDNIINEEHDEKIKKTNIEEENINIYMKQDENIIENSNNIQDDKTEIKKEEIHEEIISDGNKEIIKEEHIEIEKVEQKIPVEINNDNEDISKKKIIFNMRKFDKIIKINNSPKKEKVNDENKTNSAIDIKKVEEQKVESEKNENGNLNKEENKTGENSEFIMESKVKTEIEVGKGKEGEEFVDEYHEQKEIKEIKDNEGEEVKEGQAEEQRGVFVEKHIIIEEEVRK